MNVIYRKMVKDSMNISEILNRSGSLSLSFCLCLRDIDFLYLLVVESVAQ